MDEVDTEVKDSVPTAPRFAEELSANNPVIAQVTGCSIPIEKSEKLLSDPRLHWQIESNRLKEDRRIALDHDMARLMASWNASMSRFDEQLLNSFERELEQRRQIIQAQQSKQLDSAAQHLLSSEFTIVDNTVTPAVPIASSAGEAKPAKKRGNEPAPVRVAPPVALSDLGGFVGSSPLASRVDAPAQTQLLHVLRASSDIQASSRPLTAGSPAASSTSSLPAPLQKIPAARASALLHAEKIIHSLASQGVHVPRATIDRISVPPAATTVPPTLAAATAPATKPFVLPSIDLPVPFAAAPENPIFLEKLSAVKAKKAGAGDKKKKKK